MHPPLFLRKIHPIALPSGVRVENPIEKRNSRRLSRSGLLEPPSDNVNNFFAKPANKFFTLSKAFALSDRVFNDYSRARCARPRKGGASPSCKQACNSPHKTAHKCAMKRGGQIPLSHCVRFTPERSNPPLLVSHTSLKSSSLCHLPSSSAFAALRMSSSVTRWNVSYIAMSLRRATYMWPSSRSPVSWS